MVNMVSFQSRKFNPDLESVEDYIVVLQKLVVPAYDLAEREARVREAFINGLPPRLKRKVLTKDAADPLADLIELVSKTLVIDKICPSDDLVSAFNEVNSTRESAAPPKLSQSYRPCRKTRQRL
jgi:hypothetical protein